MRHFFRQTVLAGLLFGQQVAAECDRVHTVATDDTVFTIAEQYYGDHTRWSVIYDGNQSQLGGQLFQLAPGTQLTIPCANGVGVTQVAPLRQNSRADMILQPGSNFAPYAAVDWIALPMVAEIAEAALALMPAPVTYEVRFGDGAGPVATHEGPVADMTFPWLDPACATRPGAAACAEVHLSDPLVETLVMVFADAEAIFPFDGDADLEGLRLCRPVGHPTQDLERPGRGWLSDGPVEIVRADSTGSCFDLLLDGAVDAVTVEQWIGLKTIADRDLRDRVVPLSRPLSVEGLHIAIPRSHWRGTAFLYRVNAGLEALKATGGYDEIVSRHVARMQAQVE